MFGWKDNEVIIWGGSRSAHMESTHSMFVENGHRYKFSCKVYSTKDIGIVQVSFSKDSFEGSLCSFPVSKNVYTDITKEVTYNFEGGDVFIRIYPDYENGLGALKYMKLKELRLYDLDAEEVVWESAKADMVDINGFVDKDVENTFRKG